MAQTWIVTGARQLLTLRGTPGPRRGAALSEIYPLSNGALLIQDGIIREVGPSRRIENLEAARAAREIAVGGRVVMPAFVDPFVEPLAQPGPDGGGRLHSLTSTRLEWLASRFAKRALAHGITSFGAFSGFLHDAADQAKAARVWKRLRKGPWNLVTLGPADGVRPQTGRNQNSWMVLDPARSADPAAVCRDTRLPVRVWAGGRPSDESVMSAIAGGARAVDGLVAAGEGLARLLASSGALAVLLAVHFASMPATFGRALLDRGVALALGSGYAQDWPCTSNPQTVIERAGARLGLSLEEAISASTINAAHALGIGKRTGSLEPGKSADLVALDCQDYREMAYHHGVNRVHLVMKGGIAVWKADRAHQWMNPS